MRSVRTWGLCIVVLALGGMWLSISLCSAQSPGSSTRHGHTLAATPPAQEHRVPHPPEGISSGVVLASPEDPSPGAFLVQPEPTPLPEVTLFTVLTPARCLILAFVGGVVFIVVYGLQVAFLRRLR